MSSPSIAPQHAVNQVSEGSPEVFATGEIVLIDEQNVVLETGVEMRLKTKLTYDGVMVAVDMCIHAIHPLENLANHTGERFGKWNAYELSA